MKLNIEQTADCDEVEIHITCGTHIDERLEKLIEQIRQYGFSIIGVRDGVNYKLSPKEICYMESVDEKTFLYTEKQVYRSQWKLYELEERLQSASYVRISKSVLVNIDKLSSVRSLLNGKLEITLYNGEKLLVNRHYVGAFKQAFGL